jgi:dTDP-4-amino-4,6-dideoxygalactose transaminase
MTKHKRNDVLIYENEFAKNIDSPFALSFWKGRAALYAILKSLQIKEGDQVIVPAFTCVVVPNAVRFSGAIPVFVDISPNTYNIDPNQVLACINTKTRAIIVQHTFGIPANLELLLQIARNHGVALIEDCAHALGSTYQGRLLGTFGIAAFFSSQWSKPYTTGLGGIAICNDPDLGEHLRQVYTEFISPPVVQKLQLSLQYLLHQRLFSPRLYWLAVQILHRFSERNLFVGSSGELELQGKSPRDLIWRMGPFQDRAGIKQLQKFPQNLIHRKRLTEFYHKSLQAEGWCIDSCLYHRDTILLRYPLRVANKWRLLQLAKKCRVELGSWFESVLHPVRTSLEHFGYKLGQCPGAEQAANEVINLPLHPRITPKDAQRIVTFITRKAERLIKPC